MWPETEAGARPTGFHNDRADRARSAPQLASEFAHMHARTGVRRHACSRIESRASVTARGVIQQRAVGGATLLCVRHEHVADFPPTRGNCEGELDRKSTRL